MMPTFPVLPSGKQMDSSKFQMELENPAMRTKMEGGYVVSRARHTRKPRKSFTCVFTSIDNTDKATLEAFWETVRGGSVIFNWSSPQDNVTYAVRFQEGGLKFNYVGVGDSQRWDASFSLEQA